MAKKEQEKKILQPNVGGYFRLRGKVARITEKGKYGDTFFHGVVQNGGKNDGKEYISATIPLITKKNGDVKNEIPVKLFGMQSDTIYFYDLEKQESVEVNYDEWEDYVNYKGEDDKNRYILRNGLKLKHKFITNEDGKEVLDDNTYTYPVYEGLKELEKVLDKDMSVYVQGRLEFKTLEGQDGKPRHIIEPQFNTFYISENELDFEQEDFQEQNSWQQQVCFEKADIMGKGSDARGIIYARIINYKGLEYENAKFVIPFSDEDNEEYFKSIKKIAKFGDYIYLAGRMSREPKQTEVVSAFGGKSHTKAGGFGVLELHTDGTYVGDESNEEFIQGVLSNEDFLKAKKEIESNKSTNFGTKQSTKNSKESLSTFGGKTKKADPFNDDDPFSSIDVSDDDLPF